MTVTKEDLVKGVVEKVRLKRPRRDRQKFLFPEFDYEPLPKKRAARAVDTVFEIIKRNLENGDKVLISGFGKFMVKFRWARKGRNPRTGQQIVVESHRVVTFQCAPRLKHKIRTDD
jgi:integration host factor subunit alpha